MYGKFVRFRNVITVTILALKCLVLALKPGALGHAK